MRFDKYKSPFFPKIGMQTISSGIDYIIIVFVNFIFHILNFCNINLDVLDTFDKSFFFGLFSDTL